MTARRTHALMALLYLTCLVSYIDRQLISLLLSDIKVDLGLKDWQLGFISGTSFAVFYIGLGIPLSRLADRTNRLRMVSICLVLWSAMTAFCGMAANGVQLALGRVGVAVGEAGGYPASLSLISDLYPPERRSTMTGIFFSATTAGALVALIAGGYLNDLFGWRITFLIAAVPGVVLAAIIALTMREPVRGAMDRTPAPVEAVPNLWAALKLIFGNPTYRFGAIAMATFNVELFSITVWAPTYAMRAFDLPTSTVGLGLGLALGLGSGVVMIGSGRLGDMLAARRPHYPLLLAAATQLVAIVLLWAALHAGSFKAFCLLFAIAYGTMACSGPLTVAATQIVVPPRVRGTAAMMLVLLATLTGLGLGPTLVGLASDLMPTIAIDERLRRALLAGLLFNVVGALFLLLAARARRRSALATNDAVGSI